MNVLKSKQEQITLNYGVTKLNGKTYNHQGTDFVKYKSQLDDIIACQTGKVVAVRTGVVGFVNNSYGNYIILEHSDKVQTMYAHLKNGSIKVKIGDIVKQGTVIASMGATGMAYGAHLHFEVRINNKIVNPMPYIQDKIKINPYGYVTPVATLSKGNYKTLYKMRVRSGAGTEYSNKLVNQLTPDGKKNATSKNLKAEAVYNVGTIFTALEIKNNKNGSLWARSPSGYICLKDNNTTYCKKV